MDLRRICDAADEQDWVKVAFKVVNDKVAEAKIVLDELGYTAYAVEGAADDDKVIKVSTQHPDETKAKILPKFKEAGIVPISTRVTDSNKRLDEYILGSLRANGLESAVNIEQHKDGFRVSLQSAPDAYIDLYLDGENVVVRESPSGSKPDYEAYARFAGISEQQAAQVTRKFKRWAHKVQKLDARPVADLESVRVTDDAGSVLMESEVKALVDEFFGKGGAKVKRESWGSMTVYRITPGDTGAGDMLVGATQDGKREAVIFSNKFGSHPDAKKKMLGLKRKFLSQDLRVSDAVDRVPLSEGAIRIAANSILGKGNATIQQVSLSDGRAFVVEYKGHEKAGFVNAIVFNGKTKVTYAVGGDDKDAQDKIRELARELDGSSKVSRVSDAGFSLSSIIKEALEATGTADVFEVRYKELGADLESKESDTTVGIRKSRTGKGAYKVYYTGDTTPPKVAALMKSLRERLAADKVRDSISNAEIIDPVREAIGDAEIIEALVRYMSDIELDLEDFVDHLKRTYDLDYVEDSASVGDVVYAVIRDMGATGLVTADAKNGVVHISLAGSKEPLAQVKRGENGSYRVYPLIKREELTTKQEEFIDALAEALAANLITDSLKDLKLPKFSSNAKLNKLCTYLAEAVIKKYDTLDAALEELEHYKDSFSDDLGYGYIQNGNIHNLVSDDDALAYLHDAGYTTKMSGDAAWDSVCRTMGQVIRTLLEHKEELLKQKVTDAGKSDLTTDNILGFMKNHPGYSVKTVEPVGYPYGTIMISDDPSYTNRIEVSKDANNGRISVREVGNFSSKMQRISKLLKTFVSGKFGSTSGWGSIKDQIITDSNDAGAASKKYRVSLWPFSGYRLLTYDVSAYSEEEALDKAIVKAIEKKHPTVIPDSEVDEGMEDDPDMLYVDATMEGAPYPVYVDATNLRIQEITGSKVYDSTKIKSASLREALKRAGKLTDSAPDSSKSSEEVVKRAIAEAKLKVPAKMRDALLRLAKCKTPIEQVEFKQERIASNIHNMDAYDYADVFYYYTAANKHATVSWDGEITGAFK